KKALTKTTYCLCVKIINETILIIKIKNENMKTQNNPFKNFFRNTNIISLCKLMKLSVILLFISSTSSCTENIFDVADRYKVVFWFNQETSSALLNDGAETLTFYINDKAVATSNIDDIYWETAPSCDDTSAISTTIDLLPKLSTISYKVTDQTGYEYFNGTQNLTTNYCNKIYLFKTSKD
ncbi:MAG: hypothetical protein R2807_11520, partial [Chitinophagales bacterium]